MSAATVTTWGEYFVALRDASQAKDDAQRVFDLAGERLTERTADVARLDSWALETSRAEPYDGNRDEVVGAPLEVQPTPADPAHEAEIQTVADVLFRGAPMTDDVRAAWSGICVALIFGGKS